MGITQIGSGSMFSVINNNYSKIGIDSSIKKPWDAMTTTEKFIHIITVGIWSPSVPNEEKLYFDGFLDTLVDNMFSQRCEQTSAEFYNLTVSYNNGCFYYGDDKSIACSREIRSAIEDKIHQEEERLKVEINKREVSRKSYQQQQTKAYHLLSTAESNLSAVIREKNRLTELHHSVVKKIEDFKSKSLEAQQETADLFWAGKIEEFKLTNLEQAIVHAETLGDCLYILNSNSFHSMYSLRYATMATYICAKFADDITKVNDFLSGTGTEIKMEYPDGSFFSLSRVDRQNTEIMLGAGVIPFSRVWLEFSKEEEKIFPMSLDELKRFLGREVSERDLDIISELDNEASKQLSDLQRIQPELSFGDELNLQHIGNDEKRDALENIYEAEKHRLSDEYSKVVEAEKNARNEQSRYQTEIDDLQRKISLIYQEKMNLQEQLERKIEAAEAAEAVAAVEAEAAKAEAAKAAEAESKVRTAINNKDFHALLKISKVQDYSSLFDKGTMDEIRQVFSAELKALHDIISLEKGNERELISSEDISGISKCHFHRDTDGKIRVSATFETPNWSHEEWKVDLNDKQLSLVFNLLDQS
ncbi:hypothetical protein F9222_25930 [Escherichia coli]|nr:hypothetical protein F9222_25930 [Escherichia coli]